MSVTPRLAPGLRQRLALAPRQSESLRLLALTSVELAPELDTLLAANPLLETEDSRAGDDAADGPDPLSELESWAQLDWPDAPGYDPDADDTLPEPPASEDLHSHLLRQLTCESMSERDRAIALVIVDVLDEDGYLRADTGMFLDALAELEPPVSEAEVEAVVHRVQTFEPSGVGARDLPECLLLQLRDRPPSPIQDLAYRLVGECFDMLARVNVPDLARFLGSSPEELEEALRLIRTLDPHPGFQLDSTPVTYLVPELLALATPEGWRVELNPAATPRLFVNEQYAAWLSSRKGGENHPALADQLAEARWLVRSLAQREDTLLRVGRTLAARQGAFLRAGPAYLTPLTLREVAEDLGLHESTVSRAVQGKSIAAPRGVIPLRGFFSVAVPTAAGSATSAAAVQTQIKRLIEAESPADPLSDAALVDALGQRGVRVARRTVAKYRQAAGFANAHERRSFSRPSLPPKRKGEIDAEHYHGSPSRSDPGVEKLR